MKRIISSRSNNTSQDTVKPAYPSADLIKETKALWEPRLGRPLSTDEAKQLIEDVAEFFHLLHGWKTHERRSQKPDDRKRKDDF